MKSKILSQVTVVGAMMVTGVFGVSLPSAQAEQIRAPEVVFAPNGFDDNDNIEVVLHGHFPDSCYQAGEAKVSLNGQEIKITNLARRIDSKICTDAIIPWSTTVRLGVLKAGIYSITADLPNGQKKHFANLPVAVSGTTSADDYQYAYVSGAMLDRTGNQPVLSISGSFDLTCMELGKILIKESPSVITVQPTVRRRPGQVCSHTFAPIPYTKHIPLNPRSKNSKLIHVRSVNGQALNQILE